MDFMTAVKTCFSKYVDWNGRAQRSEYWWWTLFVILVSIAASIIDAVVFGQGFEDIGVLNPLWSLATLLPSLFVGVRRLHDTDRSGWWMLIILVPLIGAIVLLVFFIMKGTEGENRFGPDPLG